MTLDPRPDESSPERSPTDAWTSRTFTALSTRPGRRADGDADVGCGDDGGRDDHRLKKALEQFPDARSVSIDTWGVDWAPLDENGDLVGDVIAYRDERTSRTLDAFRERIGDREFSI